MKKPKMKFRFRNYWKSKYIEIQIIPVIIISRLEWKDKHNYPSIDSHPIVNINWLGFKFEWGVNHKELIEYLKAKYYNTGKCDYRNYHGIKH